MNTELTELVFILDRSGSMGGLESDTIGGFNGMIAKQKAQEKNFAMENISLKRILLLKDSSWMRMYIHLRLQPTKR